MATAPAVSIRWIPEDDLLLKNAVEGGASLEALAKGAVQFSRRFTLRELRDRWYSLLYDPEISGQSSACMFELEISGFNSSSKFIRSENNLKGSKEMILQKRKLESVRRKYYAMRKKFRSEIFSNSDLGFFEPNPHEFSGHIADFQKPVTLDGNSMGQNCILGDSISDHLRLQEEDLDILRQAFPETIGDIAVASGAANASQTGCPNSFEDNCTNGIIGSYGFDGNVTSTLSGGNNILDANIENRSSSLTLNSTSRNENPLNASVGFEDRQFKSPNSDGFSSFQTIMFASEQPHLRHLRVQDVSAPSVPVSMPLRDASQVAEDMLPDDVDGQESRCAVHTGEFGDPDSLLNLSNDDEILLMDVDETNAEDRSCYDNIVSVIQDSHIDDRENDVAIVDIANVTVAETSCVPSPTSNPVVLEVIASSSHEEEQINLHAEVNIPSKSTSNSDITEVSEGKIFCTLNTEDTEIPCNDDIFLLIHPSTSFGSSATQPDIKGSMDLSATAHEKNNEQVLNLPTKARDSTKAFGGPQKSGMYRLSESHSTHPQVGFSANTEMPDSRANTLLPGFANKAIGDSSKGRLLYTIPKACSDSLVEKDITGGAMKVGNSLTTVTEMIQSTEATSGRIVVPESVIDSLVSDEEESQIDADVPYFSDVEAMILEMDLDPYDQDSHLTRQASSYMCEDTKRAIIRLEQGTCSCLQRVMTSQGALAILYGRHLRHYIKKPEVVLGRSTDDVDVDIDLRKEGRANKISRRQAIIKMEADGSFLLKNLGKSLVAVNGITVATGQLLTLSSGCLIEIRGMSFVFEINQKYVKQNLGNVIQRNKEKSIKPERFT